jgi:peptidyl-tRNA hydrolase
MTQKPDLTLDNLEQMLQNLILAHGHSLEELKKIQQIINHAQQFCEGVIEAGQEQIYEPGTYLDMDFDW